MRRIILCISVLMLIITLACGASAATQASEVKYYGTVSADGSCQMTVSATLRLDQTIEKLTFPIPENASSVTLNGTRVHTQTQNGVRLVDLSDTLGVMTGTFSLSIGYTLNDVIHTGENDALQLQLPMLSGFPYPVQSLEFSVTLPGEVPGRPAFSSGYHQANIEKDLSVEVQGATITGRALKALKDHETLVMTLPVQAEMFPRPQLELPDMNAMNVAITVSALVALLYWLLFLRCAPPRRMIRALPPEGCTAGELGAILHLKNADLTMMVFSWAQLGYILIQTDRQGRVILHKRMDMGNERSSFERRIFGNLFGKRRSVDTSGDRFASLDLKVRKMPADVGSYVRKRSGNPQVFRALASAVGLFGSISIGTAISSGAALQWFLIFVMAVLGVVSSWWIHRWAYSFLWMDRRDVWIGLGLSLVWIVLGIAAGQAGTGIWVALLQLLAGLMAAFGGRRTEDGRLVMAEILGLRRYLRGASRAEVQRICLNDPDYFHNLAPYALAMGVERHFARCFGKNRLSPCPWLTTGMDEHLTAREWCRHMRGAADAMQLRTRQRKSERLLDLVRGIIGGR